MKPSNNSMPKDTTPSTSRDRVLNKLPKKPADEYERRVTSYLKKKYNEDVEPISELKKSTLGSYAIKAKGEMGLSAMAAGAQGARGDAIGKSIDMAHAKKRSKGVDSAIKRLTKEENDLDEAASAAARFNQKVKQAQAAHEAGDHKKAKYHLDTARNFMLGVNSNDHDKIKDSYPQYKKLRDLHTEEVVAEGLNEMDKSAPQPGRDGKVSHSTYGSRDKKGSDYFKGKEAPGKPITKKQMEKDTLDILKKHGMAEESIQEAVTVKKEKYSWGKMMTVHDGSETSYPLHPEHQAAIKNLRPGMKTTFKDETNSTVHASREDDMVHLHRPKTSNKLTAVPYHHFDEQVELGFKNFKNNIIEKTLTPAEKKKREEVAKAIERENPNMPMGMKMGIATMTAKRVAESEDMKPITELSSELLARYKKAASTNASAADAKGDVAKGNKRFSGIMKATKKQFNNDMKTEEVDDEGKMAKGQLMRMVNQASALAQMMEDDKQLDGWVQSKLTMASDYLDSVHDYLMHNKQDVDEMEEETVVETKGAPKGFHFTRDGKLKRGDANQDGDGGPMLRSDPLDKQRNKIPAVSEDTEGEHLCAKHVYSNMFGEGVVLEGIHADPDEDGNIEWYGVEFKAGIHKVYTEDLIIMHEMMHGNHKKKKRMIGQ